MAHCFAKKNVHTGTRFGLRKLKIDKFKFNHSGRNVSDRMDSLISLLASAHIMHMKNWDKVILHSAVTNYT